MVGQRARSRWVPSHWSMPSAQVGEALRTEQDVCSGCNRSVVLALTLLWLPDRRTAHLPRRRRERTSQGQPTATTATGSAAGRVTCGGIDDRILRISVGGSRAQRSGVCFVRSRGPSIRVGKPKGRGAKASCSPQLAKATTATVRRIPFHVPAGPHPPPDESPLNLRRMALSRAVDPDCATESANPPANALP